jgi:hypothetical protein
LPLRRNQQPGKGKEAEQRKQKRGKPERQSGGSSPKLPGEIRFSAELTVPLAALLDLTVVPRSEDFGESPREIRKGLLTELAEDFRGGKA